MTARVTSPRLPRPSCIPTLGIAALMVGALSTPAQATPAVTDDVVRTTSPSVQQNLPALYPLPSSGAWHIAGRGFGHGRGMSQWGAQGAALQGLTSSQILAFYYPGTASARVEIGNIQALLTAPSSAGIVTFFPKAGKPAPVVTTVDGRHLSGRALTIRLVDGLLQAEVRDEIGGTITASGQVPEGTTVYTKDDVYLGAGISPTTATWYRGEVSVRTDGAGLAVVNTLPMQQYLYGVVPREMPASFAAAALETQAIAARTYRQSVATGGPICDTTACQVYGGAERIQVDTRSVLHNEQKSTNDAVDATEGVIRVRSLTDSTPIFMQYSSSSGGQTVAHSDPERFPYLIAQEDPYSSPATPGDRVSAWTHTLTREEVSRFCAAGGLATALEVTARDGKGQWGGRVTGLNVHCTNGVRPITAELDRRLGMRSSWWSPTTAPGLPSMFYLSNTLGATADVTFEYGPPGNSDVMVGDWDGDGITGIGYRTQNILHLRNEPTAGDPDLVVAYGQPGDDVLVGDWDGNGTETVAVRRANVFHVKNVIAGGEADLKVPYGRATDEVFVGDWDGDGIATPGVRRGNVFHLKNSWSGGQADVTFAFGRPTDEIVVGDWDGSGIDRPAVRRQNVFHLQTSFTGGQAQRTVAYGRPTDLVLVGDWNGDGTDGLGLHRLG